MKAFEKLTKLFQIFDHLFFSVFKEKKNYNLTITVTYLPCRTLPSHTLPSCALFCTRLLLLLASGGPGQCSALIWARPILLRYVNRYPGLLNRLSMSSSRPVSSCRMWAPHWQLSIWFTVSGSPQTRQPGSSMAPNLARSALDSEEWPVRSWFHVTSSHLFRNFFGRFFMVVAQFWRYLLSFSLRSFLMTALVLLSVSGRISWAR